jgi:hypothetical protein
VKVGDTVLFSKKAVKVYGFDSDIGLVVDTESYHGTDLCAEEYPSLWLVLINGKVELVGSQINAEGHVKVLNEC